MSIMLITFISFKWLTAWVFYNYLHENNVYAQVHYAPLHLMPYYQQWGNRKGDLPIVEEYYEHCLSLPMYPTLTNEEQEYVINKVIEYIKQ